MLFTFKVTFAFVRLATLAFLFVFAYRFAAKARSLRITGLAASAAGGARPLSPTALTPRMSYFVQR
jgi:hypothetical protein